MIKRFLCVCVCVCHLVMTSFWRLLPLTIFLSNIFCIFNCYLNNLYLLCNSCPYSVFTNHISYLFCHCFLKPTSHMSRRIVNFCLFIVFSQSQNFLWHLILSQSLYAIPQPPTPMLFPTHPHWLCFTPLSTRNKSSKLRWDFPVI